MDVIAQTATVAEANEAARARGGEFRFVPRSPSADLPVSVSEDAVALLTALRTSPRDAFRQARDTMPTIIESQAAAERLGVTWGQVKTRVNGTTVEGDPGDIHRLDTLVRSAWKAYDTPEATGIAPQLLAMTPFGVVEGLADDARGTSYIALEFLVRAIAESADPARVSHTVGAFLCSHGLPWLHIRYKDADDYRLAVVQCQRFRDGRALTELMVKGVVL